MAPLMHSSCNDGVIQLRPLIYAVLEFVKISHVCFVHPVSSIPHTLYSIGNPANLEATVEAWILAFLFLQKRHFSMTSQIRHHYVQVWHILQFFQSHKLSGWFVSKIMKSCLNLSKLRQKYRVLSVLFFRTRCICVPLCNFTFTCFFMLFWLPSGVIDD